MRIIIVILLFFNILNSFSQTFFETAFTLDSGRKMHGFMVYYNEQNSYMRLAFETEDEYQIVNLNFTASTGISDDSVRYFLLKGGNPEFISYSKEVLQPIHFIWLWDKSDSTLKPMFCEGNTLDFSEAKEVDFFNRKNLGSINEDFLDLFYNSAETDFHSFIDAINNPEVDLSKFFKDKSKVQMHIIVIANTATEGIGPACNIDKNGFVNQFEEVAQALKIPVQKYIIEGENYSKKNLDKVLDSLNPGANDIILFLYSGHGFRWENQLDNFPAMDTRASDFDDFNNNTTTTLNDVYNVLKRKNTRFLLVMANCCNSGIGMDRVTPVNYLSSMSLSNFRKENLAALFLQSKVSIIASAASPGEYSWCNSVNGGFFTYSFLQAFRQELGVLNTNKVSWDNIFLNTEKLARQKSIAPLCPDCTEQNAMIMLNAKRISQFH